MKLSEIARFTNDVPAMTDFYRNLLGSEPVFSNNSIASFRCDDVTVLIHENYTPGPNDLPSENHIAFAVNDLDSAFAQLQAQGVTIVAPPTEYPWGRSAYIRDSDGNLIELAES
ncbi:MAG: VOC family protein [Candidatus Hydrogenedentes bacterium]|nr:VOC family protein [Candidatus Hydrogenedentota bacterium]